MTTNIEATASLFPRDQFRMRHLQAFNWGTFSGLHDIPISERGFLFVGPSGAGKSTLLDAFSSLLVPPRWVDFNAAAREAERTGRDRSLLTYIRGAWGERRDGDSGEIGAQFLRAETTWSALSLSFQSQSGQNVTLVQLFWIRGKSTTAADVRRHYLVLERPFDLRELEAFDLDLRKLKRQLPDAFIRDDFNSYCERFRRLLGIESELALRLLHKTQSAKNLGDLNTFLRDFMLDRPETFAAADRLVSEFAELNAAHQAVVTAREQIAVLDPARQNYQQWLEAEATVGSSTELREGVEAFSREKKAALLKEKIESTQVRLEGLATAIQASGQEILEHRARVEELVQRRRDSGGDRIEQWEAEKSNLELQRAERCRKCDEMKALCSALAEVTPSNPEAFSDLVAKARREVEGWHEAAERAETHRSDLEQQRREATASFNTAVTEVKALRAQASNIPAEMLELRRRLAAGIDAPESALPFVGELVEVRDEDMAWQGAIERALRGFALSVLVDERRYADLSRFVNETPLGRRLVYHRVDSVVRESTRAPGAASLVRKLRIKDGSYREWLAAELANRYDYVCADTLTAFRNSEYSITREGQIRRGKSRHEKDDSYRIDDRRHWVLGFSNRAKLELFEAEAHAFSLKIEDLRQKIEKSKQANKEDTQRYVGWNSLMNLRWTEIDVEALVQRISRIDKDLKQVRDGNASLQAIEESLKQANAELTKAQDRLSDLKGKQNSNKESFERALKVLDTLAIQMRSDLLTEWQRSGLASRLGEFGELTLDNLADLVRKVADSISREIEEAKDRRSKLQRGVEERFAEFKRTWPTEASDVDATLASASDFLAKLDRLEKDGLPAHEERFFELLRTQSQQNLTALSSHLSQAAKEIIDRLDLVNDGLREAPFNPGTYLQIESVDRQLVEVREFKQEMRQALSHAWSSDRSEAEARFLILRRLVERLGSRDPADLRWRESVLDVRQHVDFIGRELDGEGNEVESYRSGSGKSGGQRQKLATTCLAAALRYQLGGHERGAPAYAPVILDEAFDKADNEFTTLAMNIFTNFGFQMIVATPLKSVMTLEPFIGGACLVAIKDRKQSGVLLIEYDSERGRLMLPERQTAEAEGANTSPASVM